MISQSHYYPKLSYLLRTFHHMTWEPSFGKNLLCTCENLLRNALWNQMKVQQRGQDPLHISKHWRKAKTEEHNKEEHSPDLGTWHLYYCLSEHNESQTCAWGTLRDDKQNDTFKNLNVYFCTIKWSKWRMIESIAISIGKCYCYF